MLLAMFTAFVTCLNISDTEICEKCQHAYVENRENSMFTIFFLLFSFHSHHIGNFKCHMPKRSKYCWILQINDWTILSLNRENGTSVCWTRLFRIFHVFRFLVVLFTKNSWKWHVKYFQFVNDSHTRICKYLLNSFIIVPRNKRAKENTSEIENRTDDKLLTVKLPQDMCSVWTNTLRLFVLVEVKRTKFSSSCKWFTSFWLSISLSFCPQYNIGAYVLTNAIETTNDKVLLIKSKSNISASKMFTLCDDTIELFNVKNNKNESFVHRTYKLSAFLVVFFFVWRKSSF